MAGDWIKMRTNLDSNPRVLRMADELELPPLHVIGALWRVWGWADSHSLDGNGLCVTDVTLDRLVNVPGFARALRIVEWLRGDSLNLVFPNFAEHNGRTAKNRAETAERVAKHRNASVTQKALPEKRREEKSITGPVPAPKPCRVIASEKSEANITGRGTLASVIVRPLPANGMTNGHATTAIETITDRPKLVEWWRKHLGTGSPLTGPTALDLLHEQRAALLALGEDGAE